MTGSMGTTCVVCILRPNPLAPWELRVGTLRVFYDVDERADLVNVLAIGVKKGNRLLIDDKEIGI